MTRAQWLIEEEERLIRVRDEIDSILGVHAAHCVRCGPSVAAGICPLTDGLRRAEYYAAWSVAFNQSLQDEEQPMPHYSPVKL